MHACCLYPQQARTWIIHALKWRHYSLQVSSGSIDGTRNTAFVWVSHVNVTRSSPNMVSWSSSINCHCTLGCFCADRLVYCRYDAIVVGLGGHGSASLYHLAKLGLKVWFYELIAMLVLLCMTVSGLTCIAKHGRSSWQSAALSTPWSSYIPKSCQFYFMRKNRQFQLFIRGLKGCAWFSSYCETR